MATQRIILVDHDHPLHYNFVHTGMSVNNVRIGSVNQAFYRAMLVQHDIPSDTIEEFDASNYLRHHPEHIPTWCEKKGFTMSKQWQYHTKSVLNDFFHAQMKGKCGGIHKAIRDLVEEAKSETPKIRFVVCSHGSYDFLWTSGLRKSTAERRGTNYPGRNRYGVFLQHFIGDWFEKEDTVYFGINKLFTENVTDATMYVNHPYSVLLLSDSLSRQTLDIDFGQVESISGAQYHELVYMIQEKNIDFKKFDVVVFQNGTNVCELPPSHAKASWRVLEDFIFENFVPGHRPFVIVSSGVPHPTKPNLAVHSRYVEKRLEGSGFLYVNWCDPIRPNPFHQEGHYNYLMYDRKDKNWLHLSHAGMDALYEGWAKRFQEMRNNEAMLWLGLHLGKEIYPNRRHAQANRKRK